MKTPDITAAQLVALVKSTLALAVAFGFGLSDVQVAAIIAEATVVAAILIGSDAAIRRKRAEVFGPAEAPLKAYETRAEV